MWEHGDRSIGLGTWGGENEDGREGQKHGDGSMVMDATI